MFPEISHPIVHDKVRSFGFAHRLDTICSGLLLAAVTFETSALLQWQFSGGILMREYMVFCAGRVPLKLQEVDVRIFHSGEAQNCAAEVSTSGAPSHTVVTVQAHSAFSSQPSQEACQGEKWRVVLSSFLRPVLPTCTHTTAVAAASLNSHDMCLITGADAISRYSIAASTSATVQEWELGGDAHSLVRLAGFLQRAMVWDEVVNCNLERSLYRAMLR